MPDTQYFTNIDGKYVKDAEARQQLNDLEDYVESLDQPWTPLQDGYSNFWFELTNDTLSPWLNFSAKTDNAVIDWGDGSGEVTLDTLTPTHTYAKAGKYVVKVKGVAGIARQQTVPYEVYISVLKSVELNSDVVSLSTSCFMYCINLENIAIPNSVTSIGNYAFYATSLKSLRFPENVTSTSSNVAQFSFKLSNISIDNITNIGGSAFQSCASLGTVVFSNTLTEIGGNAFQGCISLKKIVVPSSVTSMGSYAFASCTSLTEIHVQATTPPTLGNYTFQSLPSDYIIYVPVGYGDTYKAASGWSTYADHILEEGETPTRAMVAKFNNNNTDNEEMR